MVFMSPLTSHTQQAPTGFYNQAIFRNPPRVRKGQRKSSDDDVQTLAAVSEQTSPVGRLDRLEPLPEESIVSTKEPPRRSSMGLQRSKRAAAAAVKTYAEPSIHTKLRQGDEHTIPKENPYRVQPVAKKR